MREQCPGIATALLFPASEPWMRPDAVAYAALQHARQAEASAGRPRREAACRCRELPLGDPRSWKAVTWTSLPTLDRTGDPGVDGSRAADEDQVGGECLGQYFTPPGIALRIDEPCASRCLNRAPAGSDLFGFVLVSRTGHVYVVTINLVEATSTLVVYENHRAIL